jgi:hypothetical protein
MCIHFLIPTEEKYKLANWAHKLRWICWKCSVGNEAAYCLEAKGRISWTVCDPR